MTSAHEARLSPIGVQARAADPDRFYAGLFAPAECREALFALLAFNHEVARVRDVVSEGLIGEMRLAWWREVLDEIEAEGPVRPHPVAEALQEAYRARPFLLEPLRMLIDSRSFDLYNDPMPDLPALEAYAKATGGGLHRVMSDVLGADAGGQSVAEAAGTAWALTGILRALPIHSARRQLYLPERELRARGISPNKLFQGEVSEGLEVVIDDIITCAQEYFAFAKSKAAGPAFPAISACTLLPLYWRQLRRRGRDPLRAASDVAQLVRLTRLATASVRVRV